MNLKFFTIDELIEAKLSGANLSDDEENIPPFFKDAVGSSEKLLTYFFCEKNGGNTLNEVNSVHNEVLNTHSQSARQTKG
ncbi:hypothetical protein AVEN_271764-1, partial [Araneus ventricosus]